MATAYKEIFITYEGDGVRVEKKTPTSNRPLLVYESKNNPRIPSHIASLWFNHATFTVVDKTDDE